MTTRQTPNPKSMLLASAVVGGAGLHFHQTTVEPPAGMAAVVLFVPAEQVLGKSAPDIQADLGLPWAAEDGGPVWFDEL